MRFGSPKWKSRLIPWRADIAAACYRKSRKIDARISFARYAAAFTAFVLVLAAFALTVASRGATRYLLPAAGILPAALALLWWNTGESGGPSAPPAWTLRSLLILYVLGTLVFLSWTSRTTGEGDESAYCFQARVFAAGGLAAEAPTMDSVDAAHTSGFFFNQHIMRGGRWFGKYPPGWPALLAVAYLARLDWLLNPLLGLVLLWIVNRIGLLCFDEQTGRLAVIILLLSPMFFFNCLGYYSHVLSAVLLAAASWCTIVAIRRDSAAAAAVALLALGADVLVRPFSAACFWPVVVGAMLWSARSGRKRAVYWLTLAVVLPGAALGVMVLYNHALTGSYLLSLYALYRDSGAPTEVVLGGTSLVNNLMHLTVRSIAKTTVAVVAFPCLVLVAGAALLPAGVRRSEVWLLAALSVVLVAGYMVQTDMSASVIGERYYFESLFAWALLAARGCQRMPAGDRFARATTRAAAVLIVAMQLVQFGYFGRIVHQGLQPLAVMRRTVEGSPLSNAVVFMKSSEGFRADNLNLNSPAWKRARLVFLPDPGVAQRAAYTCALSRQAWVVFSYRQGRAYLEDRQPISCAARAPRPD